MRLSFLCRFFFLRTNLLASLLTDRITTTLSEPDILLLNWKSSPVSPFQCTHVPGALGLCSLIHICEDYSFIHNNFR